MASVESENTSRWNQSAFGSGEFWHTTGFPSYGVLRHRRLTSGSLTSAVFEKMLIGSDPFATTFPTATVDRGFQINSCASVVFRDCIFDVIKNYGILFQLDDAYANANLIQRCKFSDVRLGVYFTQTGQPTQRHANSIVGCWFESERTANALGAIRMRGFGYGLTIAGNYFRKTATSYSSDIHLDDAAAPGVTGIPVQSVVIRENTFAEPNPDQESRIRNVGHTSYLAEDNDVMLVDSTRLPNHQSFASCEGTADSTFDYKVWLHRNAITYSGAYSPSYTDAVRIIPSSVTNPQTVDVVAHPASTL